MKYCRGLFWQANKKASEHDQTVTVENLHSLTESVKGLHELHTHLRMAVVGFTETMRQRVSEVSITLLLFLLLLESPQAPEDDSRQR